MATQFVRNSFARLPKSYMCGIAGYIGSQPPDDGAIARTLTWMTNRGPDDQGTYRHEYAGGNTVVLLHTRLSILDVSPRAAQPFRHRENVLCYNGEIFNYQELRRELSCRGLQFQTESDTEVLAQWLACSGSNALDSCEGMWAFAFYNKADGSLLLSRDRFGEKPLYLHRTKHGVYFASEVKFLNALLGRKFTPDLTQLTRYLVNGYKSLYKSGSTFFEAIEELPPGECLQIDASGRAHSFAYWQADFEQQDSAMSYETAVSGTRKALKRSVEIRLRSDVPLAFCLSGGVDSNVLVGVAKNLLGADVHGFTIVNTDERYEEAELVEHAVAEFGIRHTTVAIERTEFIERLRRLIRIHDAPVYTITYYAHWLLMDAVARAGYKVVLSGTGADELFSGYYDHHNAYLSVMKGHDGYSEALDNWRRYVAPIVRNPYLSDADYYADNPDRREHIYLDADAFAENLKGQFSEDFEERHYTGDLLRNRMANELMHESVPVILHEDDLNSMSYSIENRSPFLDRGLFDWSQKIPTRHLIQKGRAKSVLRDAVKGIAPARVIENPRKVGFNAPVMDFLDLAEPDTRGALLDDGKIFEFVRKEAIEELIAAGDLPNSRSKFLFNFLNARLFLEEYAS